MDMFEYHGKVRDGVGEDVERVGSQVIGAAIEVHRHLGPGYPEIVYRRALCHELTLLGIPFVVEVPLPVVYKGVEVGQGRLDLLVADRLIVELKAVDMISPVHVSQALAYLTALQLELALIINFNVASLKDGLRRVVRKQ
jgi:GxxExxY protein